ncbi:MAG: hypothetical protein ACPL0B_03125, partial [Anaerolineales bacterium]
FFLLALVVLFFCFLVMLGIYLLWNLLIIIGVLFIVKRQNNQKDSVVNQTDEEALRQEAVAVAVSVALAQKNHPFNGNYPLPPTAVVSAWQAVLRSQVVKKQGVLR